MDNKTQENHIDSLIKSHGKRVKPDDSMSQNAYKNIHSHWQKNLQQNKVSSRNRFFQMAAVITLMVSTVFIVQYNLKSPEVSLFASSYYSIGEFSISTDGENWNPKENKTVTIDVKLKTNSNSFATLNLLDNTQLRLNSNTELKIIDSSTIELIAGEIYHDADLANSKIPLTIQTKFGSIHHIGTRYKVKVLGKELKIAVRNGLVAINNDQQAREISEGIQITLDDKGAYNSTSISAYDASWNWTKVAAEPFDSKNQNLHDFIIWYAHENGFNINWNNKKQQTRNVKLSGNLSHIDSSKLIKTVFLSTKFDYEINQGILSIR